MSESKKRKESANREFEPETNNRTAKQIPNVEESSTLKENEL